MLFRRLNNFNYVKNEDLLKEERSRVEDVFQNFRILNENKVIKQFYLT